MEADGTPSFLRPWTGAACDQRRRNVLEAVFAIVDEEGIGQVAIRNVAKAAGISPGRVQREYRL
ncbi:MAG TPA: hypothetical protein VKZ65_05710 [Glycomyces sp.]|nr:hypothetical protein [Glycomyces sp.]